MKIKPLQNGKREITIDTAYLLFHAIVDAEGVDAIERLEIREPRSVEVKKQSKKKECKPCKKRNSTDKR